MDDVGKAKRCWKKKRYEGSQVSYFVICKNWIKSMTMHTTIIYFYDNVLQRLYGNGHKE
jgi:hypothetical protein